MRTIIDRFGGAGATANAAAAARRAADEDRAVEELSARVDPAAPAGDGPAAA